MEAKIRMKSFDTEIERICGFIKEYVAESKTNGVVLGLSGGLDSAVVATLSAKALGTEKVHCLYLPYGLDYNDINFHHVSRFRYEFKLQMTEKHITETVDSFIINKSTPLSIGNIKSRVRMIHLYKEANEFNCLVIGTTNRSEFLIGYFTKFGDGACDIEPISHLYKTEIFELAKHLGIPDEIINKAPSADLWEGQTDEKEIGMSYKELDEILKWIDSYSDQSPCFPHYEQVAKMVFKSMHKRRSIPCLTRT
jgi:NAD+ synthase